MARIYTVRCESCEVDGPLLRSGVATRPFTYVASYNLHSREPEAEAIWHQFLEEHEYHTLSLKGPS